MPDYDDVSAEEAELAITLAGDAELDSDEGLAPVAPEDGQIVDALTSEALASWNLRRIRQALGLSQQQISDKIAELNATVRLSQSQIAKIERGERPWRVDEMFAMAAALGINFLEFFRGQHNTDDPNLDLLAARLRYQQASEAADHARENWREAVKVQRDAAQILVKVAARLGIRDPEVMHILQTRWSHQGYVKQVLHEVEHPFDVPGSDYEEQAEAARKWAESEWERYLRNA